MAGTLSYRGLPRDCAPSVHFTITEAIPRQTLGLGNRQQVLRRTVASIASPIRIGPGQLPKNLRKYAAIAKQLGAVLHDHVPTRYTQSLQADDPTIERGSWDYGLLDFRLSLST